MISSEKDAYLCFLEESFPGLKVNIERCEAMGIQWESRPFFKKEGKTILSHVGFLEYPMFIEGRWYKVGALHAICSKTTHRGQGLASELIQEALNWGKTQYDFVILYTEIPKFYEKLSFQSIQEYRFHLKGRHPKGSQSLIPLSTPKDNPLFFQCFQNRAPTSNHLWVKDNGNITAFNALFVTYPNFWSLYYSSSTVVLFGAIAIVKGSLDLADLITFLLYVVILTEPIQRLGNFIRLYQEGITGFSRFMEALEVEPDIKDTSDAIDLIHVQGNVEFKNVSFKYREGYDHVLKNISLSIGVGEYVALVGPSGAGKTTLCSLIPRFYEINVGEIFIDGKNIRNVKLRSLRKQIGLVQQDVYLFAGTVIDNIRYGNLNATDDEIILAAKKAHAHEFIMSLPNGYSTDIGQRGVQLSGGQKQRLSVARVFLKNPPIIIFDEATSALDNESEKAVQDAVETLIENRTTIVIAHRLSTIRNAKRILVLTDSGIEEQGTHKELIALNGIYANLYNMQLMIEDIDNL